MSTIDVLVAIDTTTIMSTYPNPSQDPNNPTFIDFKYIYMITNSANVISGQAGGELDLKAQTGDLIRFREYSLSGGFDTTPRFYKFLITDSKPAAEELISTPGYRKAVGSTAVPNPTDLAHPKCQTAENYYWSTEALMPGRVTYHFYFSLNIRNSDGTCKTVGYYQWDPFISIHS